MLKGEPYDDLCITSEYDNGDLLGGKGGRDDIFVKQWDAGSVKGTDINDGARYKVVLDDD